MGTRHLISVVVDGKHKVAQYGQWDGYYSGQGVTVLEFLRTMDRPKFLARLSETYQPNEAQIEEMNTRLKQSKSSIRELFPSISRDTGADILTLIQNSTEPVPLMLDTEFANDTISCEYHYLINFDNDTLECFESGSDKPSHTFSLASLPGNDEFLAATEPEDD